MTAIYYREKKNQVGKYQGRRGGAILNRTRVASPRRRHISKDLMGANIQEKSLPSRENCQCKDSECKDSHAWHVTGAE